MTSLVVVDAGPLYAWAVNSEEHHTAVVDTLQRSEFQFVIAGLCLAEAAYLLATRHGAAVESAFLAGLQVFPVECPSREDLVRMAALTEIYADNNIGAADASVVALAERLNTDLVFTLDRRHFLAIRPRHCEAFRLLP